MLVSLLLMLLFSVMASLHLVMTVFTIISEVVVKHHHNITRIFLYLLIPFFYISSVLFINFFIGIINSYFKKLIFRNYFEKSKGEKKIIKKGRIKTERSNS